MLIGGGTATPRPLFLPPGFVASQPIIVSDGVVYLPGKVPPHEIIVSIGTIFPVPFLIPKGLPLSDTWSSGQSDDSGVNGTVLYLPGDFWVGPKSVSCSFPCTLVLPPVTTTRTFDPPPFVITTSGVTTTVDPPIRTTELVPVSKITVTSDPGSSPTKTIQPQPADKPVCSPLNLGIVTIKICPLAINSLPSLPQISTGPLPPGGKPGPHDGEQQANSRVGTGELTKDQLVFPSLNYPYLTVSATG